MNELITVVNDRPVVSSRQVAESFDKQHKHIMESIREVETSVENPANLFSKSKYYVSSGQKKLQKIFKEGVKVYERKSAVGKY